MKKRVELFFAPLELRAWQCSSEVGGRRLEERKEGGSDEGLLRFFRGRWSASCLAAVAWWSADVRQSTPVKAKELSLASQLLPFTTPITTLQ